MAPWCHPGMPCVSLWDCYLSSEYKVTPLTLTCPPGPEISTHQGWPGIPRTQNTGLREERANEC